MAINTLFQNIADAIREKAGTSGLLTPAQMPSAIANIPSGGGNLEKYLEYCCPKYQGGYEYIGCVYDNTLLINDCGLELIYDGSQGAPASVTVPDVSAYKNIVLQGIYQKNRTSQYNTTLCYPDFNYNQAYWAGMKDRNSSYTCMVTMVDETTITLSGNRQVIIYGMR
jgi:hypothetical protein